MDLSIWHWLIVLLVVVLIFGTKKLRNIGQDLGGAVKGFKEGMKTPEDAAAAPAETPPPSQIPGKTIDAEVQAGHDEVVAIARLPLSHTARRAGSMLAPHVHVRHRLLRNRRHRRRGADRHRPRAAAEGGAHARATCSAGCSATSTTSRPTSTARWSSTSCASCRRKCRPRPRSSSRRWSPPRRAWRPASGTSSAISTRRAIESPPMARTCRARPAAQ